MKKLIYSKKYKRKLLEIKKYLDIQFGIDVRKKALSTELEYSILTGQTVRKPEMT